MRKGRAHFALVLLVGALSVGWTPASADPDETCPAQDVYGLIARTNAYRRAMGLAPLQPDVRLFRAAERLAQDLARHGMLGHVGSDGSTLGRRVEATGYVRRLAAENVAAGQVIAEDVVVAWIESPKHRQNLASSRVMHVGAAHVTGRPACRGCSPDYWVLVLAEPRDPGPPVSVACRPPEVAAR